MSQVISRKPLSWGECWSRLIPQCGRVLDAACGNGRHAVYLAGLGHDVDAVDIDLSLSDSSSDDTPRVTWSLQESGSSVMPRELLEVVQGRMRVVAFEDTLEAGELPVRVQRLCAIKS
jgi:SAM-dependent methyltransferase